MGGRMPLSSELSAAVRELVDEAAQGCFAEPEMAALQPLFELQRRWSAIPAQDELLIEALQTREGHHLFVFPFGGRLVHSGLATLLAWRVARLRPLTFSLAVNDYGFELLTARAGAMASAVRGFQAALADRAGRRYRAKHERR